GISRLCKNACGWVNDIESIGVDDVNRVNQVRIDACRNRIAAADSTESHRIAILQPMSCPCNRGWISCGEGRGMLRYIRPLGRGVLQGCALRVEARIAIAELDDHRLIQTVSERYEPGSSVVLRRIDVSEPWPVLGSPGRRSDKVAQRCGARLELRVVDA